MKTPSQLWLQARNTLAASLITLTCLGMLASPAHAHNHGQKEEQAKTGLSVEKLWEMSRIGSPVVSADGQFIIAPVTTYDVPEDSGHTQLYRFFQDGTPAQALTAKGLRASGAVISPDSQHLAFISKRGDDDTGQIYVMPLTGPGEAVRLSDVPTGVKGLQWVGQHIYFISNVFPDMSWDEMSDKLKANKDSKVSAWQWNELPYSHFDHWLEEDRQAHVYRINVETAKVEPITLPMGMQLLRSSQSASSYAISPDESHIVFNSNGATDTVDPKVDLFLAKIGSGTGVNLNVDNEAPDFGPKFNAAGTKLAFLSRSIKGFYADTAVINIFDMANQSLQALPIDIDRSVTNLTWANNGTDFYSMIDDAATRRLFHIDGNSGKTKALTQDTNYGTPHLLGDKYLVTTNESFLYPARLITLALDDGEVTRLDSLNDDVLASVALGTYESVTYQGADAQDIQMWVHYPPGFDKSKKHPLMMLIHGGPHNAISDGFHYRWNAQTFASWGYVTAWPNFHGSSSFGQDFADSINPDWRTKPLKDIQEATKWFQSKSWIDTENMVAGGASYGGYLSSILLGTEHPYKALLIHAAVYNMYSQMAADFAVHSTRFGGFWENPDIYQSISPHYYADKFNTPALIIHGQLDYRVPVGQGFELFRTLQSRGIESRMIYFPDENHWILKPNNSIYWYHEVEKWLTSFTHNK